MKHLQKIRFAVLGIVTGLCNGLFGSGGGTIAVPMLQKNEIPVKNSHATSLALTLPLSIISAIFYSYKGDFDIRSTIVLIPFGLIGALAGAFLLKKIKPYILKKIFGIFLIVAGGRLLLQ